MESIQVHGKTNGTLCHGKSGTTSYDSTLQPVCSGDVGALHEVEEVVPLPNQCAETTANASQQ